MRFCLIQCINTDLQLTFSSKNIHASACYLDDALPTAFDMLCKYGKSKDKVWEALLANANSGGENVHRGSLLGAVLGANAGVEKLPPQMVNGLYDKDKLAVEIDEFVHAVMQVSSSQSEP